MSNYSISQEEFERIESYLLGKMDSSEVLVFENEMRTNSEILEKVNDLRTRIDAIETVERKRKLDQFHDQLDSTSSKIKTLKNPFIKIPRIAIAAGIAALVGVTAVFVLSQKDGSSNLFVEYFKPDAGLITSMGGNENYEFYRGMVDYKQGNYKAAISRWKDQLKLKKDNDTLNFYIGVSLMAQENTEEAIPYLKQVEKFEQSHFIPDVYHFRALAELNEGNTQIAKEYLAKSDSKAAKKLLNLISK